MGEPIRLKAARSLSQDLEAAITAFMAYNESKNLSGETLTFYRCRLNTFTTFFHTRAPGVAPEKVTISDLRGFVTALKQTHSAQTVNHCVQVLKTFFGWLDSEGFIDKNPAQALQKLKMPKKVIETFSEEQLQAVIATCGRDFYGVRDKAIILMLIDTGLRASELCGIRLDDVFWTEQLIRVTGKGSRERLVPYGQAVSRVLRAYMALRADITTGALFVTHYGDPMDRYRLRDIIKRRGEQAGITGIRLSPHTVRHSAAVAYLRNGGDTFTLQALLGHSSQEMTRRYCESLSVDDVQSKHRLYSPADRLELAKLKSGKTRLR